MYCIVEAKGPRNFGPVGVGGRGDELTTVSYQRLSAVVSNSPVIEYRVTRENTMAHLSAIETVMKGGPVLPIRFSTIAETEEEIVEKVLKPRYNEFQELLDWIHDKKELGLKVYWKEMNAVLNEIAEEDEAIKAFKAEIEKKSTDAAYYDQIEIGKMIENALTQKREEEKESLIKPLKGLTKDWKIHKTYIPELIVSAAFLVEKTLEPEFDQAVNKIEGDFPGRYKFTYVGDSPPVNFVDIVIKWGREDTSLRASRSEAKQSDALRHPEGQRPEASQRSFASLRTTSGTPPRLPADEAGNDKGKSNVHPR